MKLKTRRPTWRSDNEGVLMSAESLLPSRAERDSIFGRAPRFISVDEERSFARHSRGEKAESRRIFLCDLLRSAGKYAEE